MNARTRHRCLLVLLGTMAACSRQEPPTGAAPAMQPIAQPVSQPTFIPSAAQLERFRTAGPDTTLRQLAVADYWLNHKLMQATGMERELGGEAQAVRALQALGEAYERRLRAAEVDLPKMLPAAFTGEGMASGFMGLGAGAFAGLVTGGMTSGAVSQMSDADLAKLSEAGPIKREGAGGSAEMQVGKDGSLTQSLEFEVNEHGVNGKVRIQIRMDGCPDVDGRVTVEIEVDSQMSLSGKPGSGGQVHSQFKYERYLDDDAHLINTADGGASKLRIKVGGAENFASQSVEMTLGHERGGKAISQSHEEQGFSIFRPDEVARTEQLLQGAELLHVLMAEAMLRGMGSSSGSPWESGRCIDLQVRSLPAKRKGVRPSTAFELEAQPRAKSNGATVGGSVVATLSGGASLQPAGGKVRPDAKYHYAGPDKKEESASIAFESRSKRGVGKATLDFDTKTPRSYRVNASDSGATFTGEICSLDAPFVLNVDSVTGHWPMEFTPSDGRSGKMTGSFSADDCTLSGGGPYSVTVDDEGAATLRFTYSSTAKCPAGSRTTSVTSQLPLEPAADLNCH